MLWVPVIIAVGGVATLLSSAVVVNEVGDTAEKAGGASLKFAVLAATCAVGYMIYKSAAKGG